MSKTSEPAGMTYDRDMAIPLYLLDASIGIRLDPEANFRNVRPPEDDLGVRCILRDCQEEWVRLFVDGAQDSREKMDMVQRVAGHLQQTILYYAQYFRDETTRMLLIRAGEQAWVLQRYVEAWEFPEPAIEDVFQSCRELLKSHGILDEDLVIPAWMCELSSVTPGASEEGIRAAGTCGL